MPRVAAPTETFPDIRRGRLRRMRWRVPGSPPHVFWIIVNSPISCRHSFKMTFE